MKRYVSSGMDLEDVEYAILNDRPFDLDSFNDYYFGDASPKANGAIKAEDVRAGMVIQNTEDASELDIGDVFVVLKVRKHSIGWEEFDLTFTVKLIDYPDTPIYDIHYMNDEYVGVLVDR